VKGGVDDPSSSSDEVAVAANPVANTSNTTDSIVKIRLEADDILFCCCCCLQPFQSICKRDFG
jgi:hypothetical protein